MRKTLISISVIIAVTLLIYTVSWFLIISSIAGKINQQYSNRYIAANTVDSEQKYFVKFNKIASYGFPFKIAFQIIGWHEEGETFVVEFHTLIYIGYDLLEQSCLILVTQQVVLSLFNSVLVQNLKVITFILL